MNIVVLNYPSFEFLYSKTYDTGKDPVEANKMADFISGLTAKTSPLLIFVAAQGDATSSMTEKAWNVLVCIFMYDISSKIFLKASFKIMIVSK